jgi:hypothetical protein
LTSATLRIQFPAPKKEGIKGTNQEMKIGRWVLFNLKVEETK